MRRGPRVFGWLGMVAALAAVVAAPGAAAQGDGSNSAIGELLTQVLPDVGLERYLPDQTGGGDE